MAQPNALTVATGGAMVAPDEHREQRIALLRNTLAPGCTDDEFALFCEVARRTGLDPWQRQIYALKIKGRLVPYTGIDGLRALAQRSGEYEGQTTPLYCGPDGQWVDVWLGAGPPAACKVGVYRRGFREPLYQVAKWSEYHGQEGSGWSTHPTVMLAKCAESLALRRAFPAECEGLYVREELDGLQASAPRQVQGRARQAVASAPNGRPVRWQGAAQCGCGAKPGNLHTTSCPHKLETGQEAQVGDAGTLVDQDEPDPFGDTPEHPAAAR